MVDIPHVDIPYIIYTVSLCVLYMHTRFNQSTTCVKARLLINPWTNIVLNCHYVYSKTFLNRPTTGLILSGPFNEAVGLGS